MVRLQRVRGVDVACRGFGRRKRGRRIEKLKRDGKMRLRIRREYTWATNSAWQLTNEVHYIYDGNVVVQERDSGNQPLVTYTRGRDLSGSLQGAGGIGGLLARTDHSLLAVNDVNGNAFYHSDGNGNVTCLINAQGGGRVNFFL